MCYPMLSSQQLLYIVCFVQMISSSHQSGSHKHRSCSIGNPFFTCCQRECLQAVPNLVRTVEILGAKSNRFKVCAKEHDFVNVSNVHILEHVARVTCLICISQTVGSPPPPQLLTTPDSRFRRLDPKQLPNSGQQPTRFANATQSYGRNITTACQVNVYKFASHVTK